MTPFITLLSSALFAVTPATGPSYASPQTQEIITKMIDAHGGMQPWLAAPSISFDCHLKLHVGNDNWLEYWEQVTVERQSRRAYAKLPNPDGSAGQIAFDGQEAWSAGDLRGLARAPARFSAWRNFYLFNLPWLTQDPGVILGKPTHGQIPHDDKSYIKIEMTFEAEVGDTPGDVYALYIDPQSYRLKGYEYVMTYASMMQNGANSSPASVLIWDGDQSVSGMIVPTRYNVYWSESHDLVVTGEVSNWAFDKAFDESRLIAPEGATADASTP